VIAYAWLLPMLPLDIIDGSEPYCIACKNFGHSRISFGGCGKNKFVLERLAKEEALRLQQSVSEK